MGSIVILLSCSPCLDKEMVNFKTEIIDTGIGISSQRQSMLFVPFLELKSKQNMDKVKHGNIGIGLAGSQSLA